MAKTTFYVQVEPVWSRWNRPGTDEKSLDSIRAERITKSKPTKPLSGTVTVKLTVDIPDAAFYPLRPEAVVRIPESLLQLNPLEVVAEQPEVGE